MPMSRMHVLETMEDIKIHRLQRMIVIKSKYITGRLVDKTQGPPPQWFNVPLSKASHPSLLICTIRLTLPDMFLHLLTVRKTPV